MFEELSHYPKGKVKLFLRYLVNAAQKQKALDSVHKPKDPFASNINLEKRLSRIDDDRKDELENKVKAFYTKNRYMPLIIRIRKIKNRYLELKKTTGNKKKLSDLKAKIEKCQDVIKRMEKLDKMKESLQGNQPGRHTNLL